MTPEPRQQHFRDTFDIQVFRFIIFFLHIGYLYLYWLPFYIIGINKFQTIIFGPLVY